VTTSLAESKIDQRKDLVDLRRFSVQLRSLMWKKASATRRTLLVIWKETHRTRSLRPTVGSLNLRLTAPLLYTCNTCINTLLYTCNTHPALRVTGHIEIHARYMHYTCKMHGIRIL
jgi:hypothetical protein